jgi:hypothetical protein
MRKFIIFTYGAIATFSILMLLSGIYRIVFFIKRLSDDYWWFLIPIAISSLVIYMSIKKPILLERYKKTWLFFTVPLFVTLLIVIPLSTRVRLSDPLMGIDFIADMSLLAYAGFALIGLIISFILGTIGFLIDRKKV